jgi:hypothetical protein
MNAIKNPLIFILASLVLGLFGCVDRKSAAEIEDLKRELASLKANSKTADDILALKSAIASLKEESEAAKQQQLADGATLQKSQDKISELSQLYQVHDTGSRAMSERLDSLVNSLPIPELALWKVAGRIECRQVTIQDPDAESVSILKPAIISVNKSPNSFVLIGEIGEFMSVAAKSEAGYVATLTVGKNQSELTTASPDEAYTKIFSEKKGGGFKSAEKNHGVPSVSLLSMREEKLGMLYLEGSKNALSASSGHLSISKGDETIFQITSTKRGANMKFFDDVGDTAKINLGLRDDNGEPVIAVNGATKFDVLYPTIERSR